MDIAVLIGGRNYSADCPLLYYAGVILRRSGFQTVKISYGSDIRGRPDISIPERIELAKPEVLNALKAIDFSQYDRIVFVSKSMGTVLAGYAAEQLGISPEQVFLTPLEGTLRYMNGSCVSLSGDMDAYLEPAVLEEYCRKNNITYKIYGGVGHSLECSDNKATFRIIGEIADFYSALAADNINIAGKIFKCEKEE